MSADQDLMRKIGALLAKAEKTDNQAEADAFFEGAQRLMLQSAITEAQARAAYTGSQAKEPPIVDRYWEYATNIHGSRGKEDLLNAVARNNNVRLLLHREYNSKSGSWKWKFPGTNAASQRITLVGYAADISRVKLLYASLVIQAVRMHGPAWKKYDQERELWERRTGMEGKDGGYVGRSGHLNSFLQGYAVVINQRLKEAKARVTQEDPTGMALITTTGQEVDDFLNQMFGDIETAKNGRLNREGFGAGALAGKSADIGNPSLRAHAPLLKAGR